MARYVLKNRGQGPSMEQAQEVLRHFEDLVIEREGDKELLVSGPSQSIQRLIHQLVGWFSAALRTVPRPKIGAMHHPRVRRPE
jgi:hypothetical protein